ECDFYMSSHNLSLLFGDVYLSFGDVYLWNFRIKLALCSDSLVSTSTLDLLEDVKFLRWVEAKVVSSEVKGEEMEKTYPTVNVLKMAWMGRYADIKDGHFVVHIVIQNKSFSFTLEEFGHILGIPFKGHCSYSDKWSLDYLEISTPIKGRYQITPPSPCVIKTLIQTPRQGGHHDHVPACLCHMLYCCETSTKYNLAFFILKRMKSIQNLPKANLPYGMLLSRLFTHIVSNFLKLSNDRYILCDRVMCPLTSHYERMTRSYHGTKRCRSPNPTSSSSILDRSSSSHHVDENDDGNDEESFHSNTLSPSQLINSLSNVVPRVFKNPAHENQTMHTY
nr:hypothetical protein [Tanacetum cinerariifolium]